MVTSDGLTIAIESNMFLSCPSCLIPVMSCLPCKAPSNHSCPSAPRTSRPCLQQDVPHQCPPPMSGPSKSYPAKRFPSSKPPPRISVKEQQPHIPAQEQTTVIEIPARISTKGQIITPIVDKMECPCLPNATEALRFCFGKTGLKSRCLRGSERWTREAKGAGRRAL